MPRPLGKLASDWWDYTTLTQELLDDAAELTAKDLQQLSRPGCRVVFDDTVEDFDLAEALESIQCRQQATADNPVGMRLSALMIRKRIPDVSVLPMSLLADHPNVQFNYLRPGLGSVAVEMHYASALDL